MMNALAGVEHSLLMERDALLAKERAMPDAIWSGNSRANASIVSGDEVRGLVEIAVWVAQGLNLDLAIVSLLPPERQAVFQAAQLVVGQKAVRDLAADRVVMEVMEELRAQSATNRRAILADYDDALDKAFTYFEHWRGVRDDIRTWMETPTTSAAICGPDDWQGLWSTNWGPMRLTATGDTVTGSYTYSSGEPYGDVTGTLDRTGCVLAGAWDQAVSNKRKGRFNVTLDPAGQTWSWGYDDSLSGGTWTGRRP